MNGFLSRMLTPIGLALLFSVFAHAVLIAGVGFIPPSPKVLKDNLPVLEVVLVNAKSQSRPEKADALAQANLNRGGNTEANRRRKSPLPSVKQRSQETPTKPHAESRQLAAQAARLQAEETQQQQRVTELEKQAQNLMTQIQSPQRVETQPSQPAATPQPEQGQQSAPPRTISAAELVARSLDAARMEAEISKEWDAYQKRPRRKHVGTRTSEYRFAAYVEAWRQKVEKVGNLNYPEAAKAQKLYGQLRMTVNIRADGTVESIELNQSSGHKVLDEAARRIVELAAPYAEFPADVRRDTDILSITRTWTFTREDTLTSQ